MIQIVDRCTAIADKYIHSENIFVYILGSIIAFYAPVLTMLLWVLIFVGVDTITGIVAAKKQCIEITSKAMGRVTPKIIAYFTLLSLARGLDIMILATESFSLFSAMCGLVCILEFYSILENFYNITGATSLRVITQFTVKKVKEHCDFDIEKAMEKVDEKDRRKKY